MTGSTQGTNGRSEPRPERGRFSSRRKAEAVLRLLHGEELDALSCELGVTAATLAQWRERFLAGGQASLKSRRPMTVTTRSGACRRRSARSRWTTSCYSSARISWRQDSLWHLGGRGDEPGQLALQRTPLRHGPRLPALGGPAFDGLRAAGASQPARAVCGEARSERRRDGRRPHRADPHRARPLAVHRRGLPQGLGAAAPGRRAHLEGPGATADAGGGAARPDPRRAAPWALEPRRHDHHRPPRRAVGNRPHRLPHHPRGQRHGLHRRRPLHAGVRRHPRGSPRHALRGARVAPPGAAGRASPPGSACATTTAASTSATTSRASCASSASARACRSWPHPRATAASSASSARSRSSCSGWSRSRRSSSCASRCSRSRTATTRSGWSSATATAPRPPSARRSRRAPERLHDYRERSV